MSATEHRLRGSTRWSRAARCPRMAAYGLLGAEPAPPDDRQQGRFQRGKDAQAFHGRRLVNRFGPDDIVTEKAIAWPAPPALPVGELHADFFVISEKMTVEVKSADPDSNFDAYATQTAGEVYWDPESEYGNLTFLDHDYQERAVYPILITDETAELLEDIAAQVVEAGKTGTLPARTCEKPSDAIGKFCPFASQCFDGWEPPEVATGDETLGPLLTEAYLAKRELKARAEEADAAEERWTAAKEALLEADLPEGDTVVGPLKVRRINVRDSEKFSLSKARKSGVWHPGMDEALSPFIKLSGGHTRIDVERVGDEELAMDFGEDAPF